MERGELPNFDPEETAPSRSPWQNIDFMLATFPPGKTYMRGGTPFSPKEVVSDITHKADTAFGVSLVWIAELNLLAYAVGANFINGVTNLANEAYGLSVRAWRAVKPPSP